MQLRSATILHRKAQKQRFSQLGFWKSFKLRTGRLLDCPVFSKVQKGKVLFYKQDACGQKLQALERHGY